jgi:hypothetical protein
MDEGKRFNPNLNVLITEHLDYELEPWWWWRVYGCDWTNSTIFIEGSAESLSELKEAVGKAYGDLMLQAAGTYGMNRKPKKV